jgi:DHA2 family multidrug resistance protein
MTREPLAPAARIGVTLALAIAVFMEILDSTIANVAIPHIAGSLAASASQGTWVITAYGIGTAISIPLTGWLARRLGEVKLFVLSVLGFVVGSVLCGLSSNLEMLVAFRLLQGLLGGPMVTLSQSLLLSNYPPDKKHIAIAIWGMSIILAPVCGPILGGFIVDSWDWRWVFYINIPVGFGSAWFTWHYLKDRETERQPDLPIDTVGLILLIVGVGSLQFVLDHGRQVDWFAATEIVVCSIVALMTLTCFVIWEKGQRYPVVDLTLFRHRNFRAGILVSCGGFSLFFGGVVLLPLLMQTQMGYTAFQSGLATAPIGIFPFLLAPVVAYLTTKIDLRWILTFSFCVFSACFFWRTQFYFDMDFASIVWPQFVQGLALATFFMPATMMCLSGIPNNEMANAGSLSNFIRTIFGAMSVSLTTTLWSNREAVHHSHLAESIELANPAMQAYVNQTGALGVSKEVSLAMINYDIMRQSYFIAANEIFFLFGFLFLGLIAAIWYARPPFASGSAGGGH